MAEHLVDVRDFCVDLMTPVGVIRPVDRVSFTLDVGETVTLIGESGSGKSTTVMGLLRLLPDDLAVVSGRAIVCGQDVVSSRNGIRKLRGRAVALIPQDAMTALNPVSTIGSQLRAAVRLRRPELSKSKAHERAVSLLASVHIREPERRMRAFPHQMSGGMLQRVLIAIALAAEPQLLVADEPTSALDVTVQAGILDLLLELQERTGIAILMITHDLGVARLMSDRIHVMRDGSFVESGAVEQIVAEPATDYTRELLAAVPALGPWHDPDLPEQEDTDE